MVNNTGTTKSCILVSTENCRAITTGRRKTPETLTLDLNLDRFSIKMVKEVRQRKVESIEGQGIVVAIVKTQVRFKRIPIFLPT